VITLPRFQQSDLFTTTDGKLSTYGLNKQNDIIAKIETSLNDLDEAQDSIIAILTRLGLVEVLADGTLTLAESAINPDGTIKTSKVVTTSIVAEGVTTGVYVQNGSIVSLPNATETTILSLSLTKAINESDVDISSTLRLESSDDIIGTFKLYRDASLIDSVEYDCRTNGSTYKALIPYSFIDEAATAGARTYALSFTRNGGGSSVQANAGSILRLREFKR
jgi:hypothetical protein